MSKKISITPRLSQTREWHSLFGDSVVCKHFHAFPTQLPSTSSSLPELLSALVCPKLACFDMDRTLIKTASGRTFPLKNFNGKPDYVWLHPNVPTKLKQLYNDGWEIIIFTNQLDSIRRNLIEPLQDKLDDMIDSLGIPVSVYMSMERDFFRKPSRGMFDTVLQEYGSLFFDKHPQLAKAHCNLKKFPITAAFYVGDAAGRVHDHSDFDYNYAKEIFGDDYETLHTRFFLPETFFWGDIDAHYHFFDMTLSSSTLFTSPVLSPVITTNSAIISPVELNDQQSQVSSVIANSSTRDSSSAISMIDPVESSLHSLSITAPPSTSPPTFPTSPSSALLSPDVTTQPSYQPPPQQSTIVDLGCERLANHIEVSLDICTQFHLALSLNKSQGPRPSQNSKSKTKKDKRGRL